MGSSNRAIEAVFFHYDVLNKYEHYKEDMDAKKERMLHQNSKLAAASDMPWDFEMHPRAKEVLGFLAEHQIAAGLLLPEYPVQMDVDRFVGRYSKIFSKIIPTDETRLLNDLTSGPAVVDRICGEMGLQNHKVMFVAQSENLLTVAKEARCLNCLVMDEQETISNNLKPFYTIDSVDELQLDLIGLIYEDF
jgi:hypothetical protein